MVKILTENELKEFLKPHGYCRKKYGYDTDENLPKKIVMITVVDEEDYGEFDKNKHTEVL